MFPAARARCKDSRLRYSVLVSLGWIAVLFVSSSATKALALPSYTAIVAFGDSYSDSGNGERSTDGENWLEFLAADLGIPGVLRPSLDGGTNFAVGGATALGRGFVDFLPQIDSFSRANPVADPQALYIIWIGFVDIFAARDLRSPEVFVDRMVDNIEAGMQAIRRAGGRHFLVPTPWDTTTVPGAIFSDPQTNLDRRFLHLLFNESLGAMLDVFAEPVFRLDAYGLSREISSDPLGFGFSDRDAICPPDIATCDGFIWKDLVHPTSAAHRIVADRTLAAIPEPSSALLLGFGLLILGVRRR